MGPASAPEVPKHPAFNDGLSLPRVVSMTGTPTRNSDPISEGILPPSRVSSFVSWEALHTSLWSLLRPGHMWLGFGLCAAEEELVDFESRWLRWPCRRDP